jgi:hypothetical protein
MHDKKLQNDEGLLECCTTNGFTFTEIAALLTEFSVVIMCTFIEELLCCRNGKPNENRNIFHNELNIFQKEIAKKISPIIKM